MQNKQSPPNFDEYYTKVWTILQAKLHGGNNDKEPTTHTLSSTTNPDADTQSDMDSETEDLQIPLNEVEKSATTTEARGVRVDATTQESMLQFLRTRIQGNKNLPGLFTVPKVPKLDISTDVVTRLTDVQSYLQSLSYNHFGSLFTIKKGASSASLMTLAQDMIKFGMPIKCLEAVVVATYLTNDIFEVDRYALSFKSKCKGEVYRHIVLVVKYRDLYGALGLSRRSDLMYKPLEFESMESLIGDFKKAYVGNMHTVIKVKVGGLISHDHSNKVDGFPWPVFKNSLENAYAN
ncbi:Tubulinyl-Tyr carboxypeptidase 1 [Podochytrium sp. JEL0797]|nr:Tubulinyl-Tyr carboxypeptidase 1 [Podochytrium sp. JEL0797]